MRLEKSKFLGVDHITDPSIRYGHYPIGSSVITSSQRKKFSRIFLNGDGDPTSRSATTMVVFPIPLSSPCTDNVSPQAHRLIAQVLLVGSQVVGRAFVQAYRQAAANSAAAAANGGSKAATSKISGSNLITKQTGLDLDEACKILNVKKEGLVMEEINKVCPPLMRNGG
jgi:hypothetical protein